MPLATGRVLLARPCGFGPASRDDLQEHERQRVEVWSRVMGYHRPVTAWNVGKRQEFADRRYFEERRVKVDK